ncbi:MAG TPA: NAD(P)-dependent oxidoreductase, partial [Amaricoccus sp.]|nr:NAD(P)-dependent oxidoreductase [Amaricoccus sp.]
MPRPRIVVTRRLPGAVEARLAAEFDAVLNPSDAPMPAAALTEAMRTADGLLPCVTDGLGAELIATPGRRAAIVANFGVGVNNIDLAAARAAGLVVTNTPGVLTDATADLALALTLAATRRLTETEAVLRRGGWDGFRPTGFLGMGLQGKTLGVVGMGRIGQATARRAALGFGMRIAYFNRSPVGRK